MLLSKFDHWLITANAVRNRSQSLLDVRDDVVDALNADRDPNQPVADTQFFATRGRQIAMRSSRRMQHAGKNVAETRRAYAEPQRVHETKGGFPRVIFQLNRDQSP